MNAFIGEIKRTTGDVKISGSIAYCSQQAWIQNSSLRDNITFGKPWDERRYLSVLKRCSLIRDLDFLPDRDLTEIGEKGLNLSGGQKARVNLARACYSGADIYLLDDPLAAVDSEVGKALFEKCIRKQLHGKTRLLVTHHLHHLPKVDYVISLTQGRITEQGTYASLMSAGGDFAKLMQEHGGVAEWKPTFIGSRGSILSMMKLDSVANLDVKIIEKSAQHTLMTTEERKVGSVDTAIYGQYLKSCGGWTTCISVVVSLCLMQTCKVILLKSLICCIVSVGNNLWLNYWALDTFEMPSEWYMIVYACMGLFQATMALMLGIIIAFAAMKGARILHIDMLNKVLRAPMSFFDSTPVGRILTRFSRGENSARCC